MSFGIKKSTAGAPVSGGASNLRHTRRMNEIAKGTRGPKQANTTTGTRGDTKAPGR